MTRLFWADWNKKAGSLRLFYLVMPDVFAGL
jgi:hypothetical protein